MDIKLLWSDQITSDKGRTGIAMIWGDRPPVKQNVSVDHDKDKLISELMQENKGLYREIKELTEMNNSLRREYKLLMKKFRERLG